jgi:hypothetical protein
MVRLSVLISKSAHQSAARIKPTHTRSAGASIIACSGSLITSTCCMPLHAVNFSAKRYDAA